jgi:hypothetical protein
MSTDLRPQPPALADEAPPSLAQASAEAAGGIERLFRDALRHQRVHPLMELVRRYREKDAS